MGKKQNRNFEVPDNVASMSQARQQCKKSFKPADLIDLRRYNLTTPQKEFIKAFNSHTPIIAQAGSAGTGKTLLSLHTAFSEVFKDGSPYDHVKIIRSAVQTRDMGFTPGTVEEKLDVYSSPYRSLCDEIMCYNSKNFDNLQALGYLSFDSTSFVRGETWDNTIVILDEFQDCTFHELCSVITRLGNYSRIILCGDHKQTDLWKRSDKSGFHELMDALNKMDQREHSLITYGTDDIVRSGVVKSFLEAVYSE